MYRRPIFIFSLAFFGKCLISSDSLKSPLAAGFQAKLSKIDRGEAAFVRCAVDFAIAEGTVRVCRDLSNIE